MPAGSAQLLRHWRTLSSFSSLLPWVQCPSYVPSEKPESDPPGWPTCRALSSFQCNKCLCGVNSRDEFPVKRVDRWPTSRSKEALRPQFNHWELLDANLSTGEQKMEGLSVCFFQPGNISINDVVIFRSLKLNPGTSLLQSVDWCVLITVCPGKSLVC